MSRPAQCAVCSTAIPEGADRCVACGAVWGEDNRCPRCHALAGVRPAGDGFRCLACNAPRERAPGTTVFGTPKPAGVGTRARGRGLRLLGALTLGVGVALAAVSAALLPGALGVAAAVVLGGAGAGLGGLALRAGARASAQAPAEREGRILALARRADGVLTVTEVAEKLGMSMTDADAALTAMADGSRVVAELTDDGRVEFVFRELREGTLGDEAAPLRVRVRDAEAEVLAAARARVATEARAEGLLAEVPAEPATDVTRER